MIKIAHRNVFCGIFFMEILKNHLRIVEFEGYFLKFIQIIKNDDQQYTQVQYTNDLSGGKFVVIIHVAIFAIEIMCSL
jgi:hypothetical protein